MRRRGMVGLLVIDMCVIIALRLLGTVICHGPFDFSSGGCVHQDDAAHVHAYAHAVMLAMCGLKWLMVSFLSGVVFLSALAAIYYVTTDKSLRYLFVTTLCVGSLVVFVLYHEVLFIERDGFFAAVWCVILDVGIAYFGSYVILGCFMLGGFLYYLGPGSRC